jgi:hypothetical protein
MAARKFIAWDASEQDPSSQAVARKSRRAAGAPPINRQIAPDLSRVVWLGSCRTSSIQNGPANLNRPSNGMALGRA